ncbi:MAG: hypothetical protein ACK5XN_32485 [Bacteroidota bacterium]
MGYLIKAIPSEIITAKVILTSSNILTPGYIYDIPEYPAIKGYFWNVIYMNGEIVNGSTPYIGTSAIHIQASSVTTLQMRFAGGYLQNLTGVWGSASSSGSVGTQYLENDKLQIHNPGTLTGGDNELHLYIGANLIKY